MSEVVIKVNNVRKSYKVYKSNWQKIQSLVFRLDKGHKQRVLKGVSFEVHKGEKVGIIGTPLCGKTTLMRILAGVIRSYAGDVEVKGKITPVLDYKAAFLNVLSGRDNYYQRAKLLGWTKDKAKEHEDAVFEFAELTKEKDIPVRQYKKGMALRLGFAIFTELKPDIMIYDEKLSFSSKAFSNKAAARLKELVGDDDVTLIMTVNQRSYAEMICERGIVIDKGKVVFDGLFSDAMDFFNTNVKSSKKNDELPREEIEELEQIENPKDRYNDKESEDRHHVEESENSQQEQDAGEPF